MIRGMDRIYRLDHAITATQKTILGAFGINVPYIKDRVNRISEQLTKRSEVYQMAERKKVSKTRDDALMKKMRISAKKSWMPLT